MLQTVSQHTAELTVLPAEVSRLTTLLQSGISLKASIGMPVGLFLSDLPGFDQNYLNEKVQTIFLDGSAIDDLQRSLSRPCHVLALSAAMPGLAGAIFRKNSLCAALRTRMHSSAAAGADGGETVVRLKLFNAIAREKGGALLRDGGVFTGAALLRFLGDHPSILQNALGARYDGSGVQPLQLLSAIRDDSDYFLTITTTAREESP